MKLVDCLRSSTLLLLLVLMACTVDANDRLLAVLLPYDMYSGSSRSSQQQLLVPARRHRSISSSRRLSRSLADHHFYLDRRSIQNCAMAAEDENTFLAMDRLCEACHEMYRHKDPNLRATCRYVPENYLFGHEMRRFWH